MIEAFGRFLDRSSTVHVAAAISLGLGLFFTFVWAPHPWGWQGIDQYHDLAARLARGEPFATTDVPWGYAYFAAFFYRFFGERIWVPLTVQVIINAAAPILLYQLVRPLTSQRVAVLAALITGVFSFNNVYASTQASDALCTVIFLLSVLTLARAISTGSLALFALSGLLFGVVPQFRPNMVLFPAVIAAGYVLYHRAGRQLLQMLVFGILVIAALAPWIIRNYQLTGLFMPTSTHGGVQLWYGTLQVGRYLESRAHNPRAIFESAPLPYTSLEGIPLVIDAEVYGCSSLSEGPALVYWTDRDSRHVSVRPREAAGNHHYYEVPGQQAPTTVYYYFTATQAGRQLEAPAHGAQNPFAVFVDSQHLQDLDRHDDYLDVFDLIRLARHLAWQESLSSQQLDRDGDGAFSRNDLAEAIASLLPGVAQPILTDLIATDEQVEIRLADESSIVIPRHWSGLHTDIGVNGDLAGALASRSRLFTAIAAQAKASLERCPLIGEVRVNDVFYRREPHMMRRYMALAVDNIRRAPWDFALASAYRMVRLFIIWGSSDVKTTQQFSASRVAYSVGTVLSAVYFAVFVAGAWLAWRRRSALLWLLVPIVYVPLTICFVLTNMRYTVTMQPLMFVFVALSLVSALRLDAPEAGTRGAVGREGG
jgi:hypothetical protein